MCWNRSKTPQKDVVNIHEAEQSLRTDHHGLDRFRPVSCTNTVGLPSHRVGPFLTPVLQPVAFNRP